MKLTPEAVRHALIAAQGIAARPKPATPADVLDAIRRMGALQIDTIHVVARSPYLVLWSRLGGYDPRWLDDLLAAKAIFEYWAHEACFLPIDDYPIYRRLKLDDQVRQFRRSDAWLKANPDVHERVLARVRQQGEVKAADFERTDGKKGGTWWDWKAEKLALEVLHTRGDLMIARRENFQRVYTLRERILPHWNDADAPPLDEALRRLLIHAVRALGVTPAAWVADYFRLKQERAKRLKTLAEEGALLRADVEGWSAPVYYHPDHAELVRAAAAGDLRHTGAVLLSPFDPIVWDRRRALALFGFDYKIECYTPAPKRIYGYFTLPILWHGRLIGRLDPKAHRKEGIFEVKALHFEPGIRLTKTLLDDVAAALKRCAGWHGTPTVQIAMSSHPDAADVLRDRLS